MSIDSADEFVRLRISEDPAEYHRAGHETASIAVWEDVIRSHPDMKQWVAYNKTVPLEILRVLARDADPSVRYAVAMKRKLDRELFDALAADKDASVRHRVALNARTPIDVRARLATDPDPFVASAARGRLDEPLP